MRLISILVAIFLADLCSGADNKPVELRLRNVAGDRVSLQDYRGHPLVLNFWATWCGPCREEMPMLVDSEKKWSAQGVRFVAVSLDDEQSASNVGPFVNRYRVTFPVWTGASTATLDRLHLGKGVPDTMFLDENGLIYARVLGEIQRAELDERLAWLLGGRKGAAPAAVLNNMQRR